jgi:RNA polymerase sigma-70 factor (ECF subfamily)
VLGKRARFAAVAFVDGQVGIVVAPRGRLALVLVSTVDGGRIRTYEVIAAPGRLRRLRLAVLPEA